MKTSHVMCTSKILTDLCFTKERIKTKPNFSRAVYRILVVEIYWQGIKKFVWTLMVHNP